MDTGPTSPDLLSEAFRATRTSWIVLGIVGLITGMVALAMPGVAALATTVVLGLLLGVGGSPGWCTPFRSGAGRGSS